MHLTIFRWTMSSVSWKLSSLKDVLHKNFIMSYCDNFDNSNFSFRKRWKIMQVFFFSFFHWLPVQFYSDLNNCYTFIPSIWCLILYWNNPSLFFQCPYSTLLHFQMTHVMVEAKMEHVTQSMCEMALKKFKWIEYSPTITTSLIIS